MRNTHKGIIYISLLLFAFPGVSCAQEVGKAIQMVAAKKSAMADRKSVV